MDGTDGPIPDGEYVTQHGLKVAEIMTREIVSADPEMSVSDAAALLLHHQIKRIPIVQHGKMIGLVSRANLVQALAMLAANSPKKAVSAANSVF